MRACNDSPQQAEEQLWQEASLICTMRNPPSPDEEKAGRQE